MGLAALAESTADVREFVKGQQADKAAGHQVGDIQIKASHSGNVLVDYKGERVIGLSVPPEILQTYLMEERDKGEKAFADVPKVLKEWEKYETLLEEGGQAAYLKETQKVLAKAMPEIQWNPMITRAGMATEDGLTQKQAEQVKHTLEKHLVKDPAGIEVRKGENGYVVVVMDYMPAPETLVRLGTPEARQEIKKELSGIEMDRKVNKLNAIELDSLKGQLSAAPPSESIGKAAAAPSAPAPAVNLANPNRGAPAALPKR